MKRGRQKKETIPINDHESPKKQMDLLKYFQGLPKKSLANQNQSPSLTSPMIPPMNSPMTPFPDDNPAPLDQKRIKNSMEYAVLSELEKTFGRTIPKLDSRSTKRTFGFVEENHHITELYLTQFSIMGLIKVQTLPPCIGQLEKLQILDIRLTEITEIPPEMGNLSNLRILNLRANRIHQLCPEMGKLSQLQELDLSHNKITTIPGQLLNLDQLMILDLSENQISQLPMHLGGLARLAVLDLHQNNFEEWPDSLGQLKNLHHLDLSQNLVRKLPPTLARMEKLEILDLHSNQITQEIVQQSNFPRSVRTIYLAQNPVVQQGLEGSFPYWVFMSSPKLMANSTEIRYCPAHGKILRAQKRVVHKIKGWVEFEWKCSVPNCNYTEKMEPPKITLETNPNSPSISEQVFISNNSSCPPHEITFVELGDRIVEQCVKCHCTREEIES